MSRHSRPPFEQAVFCSVMTHGHEDQRALALRLEAALASAPPGDYGEAGTAVRPKR